MNSFKDFDIKPDIKSFVGEKIAIKRIINEEIVVLDRKIEPSKQKEGTELLTLQIQKSGDDRVVFTGSKVLIDQIRKVPDNSFPFTTTIRNDRDYFEFT